MPEPRRPAAAASPRTLPGLLALALALALPACAPVDDDSSGDSGTDRTLTVFAAASLTEPFTALAKRFEKDNPGVHVTFNFAGSSDLARQIDDSAPADVFAAADPRTMGGVAGTGERGGKDRVTGEPHVFATNTLQIAVPPDNPGDVTGLDDLADENLKVAVCAKEVPCGSAARRIMREDGVDITPASEEEDVKAALTKVELGEVDAALVYRTDVRSAGDKVHGITFDEADDAVNDYPIGALKDAPEPDLAKKWVRLVRSKDGARVLDDAGFGPGRDG